jgi:hypothetical protein
MKRVLLVRDASKLCQEVEDFLKENKIDYNIFYADEKDVNNLPVIFTPLSCNPYEGRAGFNLFKYPYLKKEVVYD